MCVTLSLLALSNATGHSVQSVVFKADDTIMMFKGRGESFCSYWPHGGTQAVLTGLMDSQEPLGPCFPTMIPKPVVVEADAPAQPQPPQPSPPLPAQLLPLQPSQRGAATTPLGPASWATQSQKMLMATTQMLAGRPWQW
jgi:hypothetical protein